MARVKNQKMPLTPKITFIGGKWYNELGKEVPKPQPKPAPGYESQGTAYDPLARGYELQGRKQAPEQRHSIHDGWPQQQEQLQRYADDELLERLAGCTCTKPQATGHVPGCVHFADALYVCERGNREHIAALAKLAETTIADLERRRIDFAQIGAQHERTNGPFTDCPDRIPQNDGRRRCWTCPYWTRHADETPFDHQKTEAT
jgi:hypothetical protein